MHGREMPLILWIKTWRIAFEEDRNGGARSMQIKL
jgi:hypothetical protein